jgi:hypothetical protein
MRHVRRIRGTVAPAKESGETSSHDILNVGRDSPLFYHNNPTPGRGRSRKPLSSLQQIIPHNILRLFHSDPLHTDMEKNNQKADSWTTASGTTGTGLRYQPVGLPLMRKSAVLLSSANDITGRQLQRRQRQRKKTTMRGLPTSSTRPIA